MREKKKKKKKKGKGARSEEPPAGRTAAIKVHRGEKKKGKS